MSPATLQKLRDPNYRIKQQNELGPDMPDTMMMGPYQRMIERERTGERTGDVHFQCGSAEVIELNMHKMTALIMREGNKG